MAKTSIVYQQAATSVMVSRGEQLCRKPNAQWNLEHGVLVTIFSSAVLMDYLVDGPPWTEGAPNGGLVFTATLVLAFATFICGSDLMLVDLAGHLFSGGRRVAVISMCLIVGCVSLSTLTLLGLLICASPYVQDLTRLCRLCMPGR